MNRRARLVTLLLAGAVGLVSLVATAPSSLADSPAYAYVQQLGVTGDARNDATHLNRPGAVDVGPDGTTWVVDRDNRRVVGFDRNGIITRTISKGATWDPEDVAVDSKGDLWVASFDSGWRVEKYAPSGTLLATLPGDFSRQIALDAQDNVYAGLSVNGGVAVYSSSGTFLRRFGATDGGTKAPYFRVEALAVNGSGDVYVGYQLSVWRYAKDGSFLGRSDITDAGTGRHLDFDTDAAGNLWDAAYWSTGGQSVERVTVLGRDGSVKDSRPAGSGTDLGSVDGLYVGAPGRLLVSDGGRHHVRELALPPVYTGLEATLAGPAKVAEPVSVTLSSTTTGPAPTSYTYAWSIDGESTVLSTAETFTPRRADAGKTLRVAVTASGAAGVPVTRRVATTPVELRTFKNFSATITGSGRIGDTLTASPGPVTPTPTSTSYVWRVGDNPNIRSTTAEFVPGLRDRGLDVTVTVTAVGQDGDPVSVSGTATRLVRGKAFGDLTPTYTGSPVVGGTVRAETPAGLPDGTTVTSTWQTSADEGRTWVDEDTGTRRPLEPGDAGLLLRLQQRLSEPEHEDLVVVSDAVTVGKGQQVLGAPELSSTTPRVGDPLVASVTADRSGTISRSWGTRQGDACVTSSPGASYRPSVADLGKDLCFRFSVTGVPGYEDATSDPVFTSRVREARKVTVNDRSVRKGQRFTVGGFDLEPGVAYEVRVTGASTLKGTAAANGRVARSVVLPSRTRSGTKTVTVLQRSGSRTVYSVSVKISYTAKR